MPGFAITLVDLVAEEVVHFFCGFGDLVQELAKNHTCSPCQGIHPVLEKKKSSDPPNPGGQYDANPVAGSKVSIWGDRSSCERSVNGHVWALITLSPADPSQRKTSNL